LRFYSDVAFVVQGDGSLDERSTLEIESSIPGIEVYRKDEMFDIIKGNATPRLFDVLPKTEEYDKHTSIKILYLKFLNVIFRLNGKKTIIIDSDLVFLQRPDAIIEWITSPYERDFYGEGGNAKSGCFYEMGFEFSSLDIANFGSGTLGVGSYVSQEELIDLFCRISDYDPELFYAWEIEQALWSVIMSRRPNPINLDKLRDVYIGHGWKTYNTLKKKAIIAHFAGAIRFKNFRYLRLARDIVKDLKAQ
jgi:hypothetical protein